MPKSSYKFSVLVAALLILPDLTVAQKTERTMPAKASQLIAQVPKTDASTSETRQIESKVVYEPPLRGAPSLRVVGATRGEGSRVFLATLAPGHAGWTIRAQPTLYWYVSESIDEPIDVTIVDSEEIDPILDTRLDGPHNAGIQSIDLKAFGISLAQGKEYVWSVSIVHDTEQRSKDTFAEGAITKVEPPVSLIKVLEAAGRGERPRLLAGAGFWYDAIDEISRLIDGESPDADQWRRERVGLLGQAGVGALEGEQGHRLKQ